MTLFLFPFQIDAAILLRDPRKRHAVKDEEGAARQPRSPTTAAGGGRAGAILIISPAPGAYHSSRFRFPKPY
jgi:hypothetical protein